MADTNFTVRWEITDNLSPTAEVAAHEALRTLHDTYAGDPGSPNVFTVIDNDADVVHTIDLSDVDGPGNAHISVWPRPEGHRFTPTLTIADARYVANANGFTTLRVRVDQEQYMAAYAMFLSGSGGDDHFDLLHRHVFDFGLPYDAEAQIVAVDGSEFLVDYTTNIGAAIRAEQR